MKIGIDIRTLMDSNYSGIPEYTYNLLNEILESDADNDYSLFYNSFGSVNERLHDFRHRANYVKTFYPNKVFNYILQKSLGLPKIDRLLDADLFFMPHINFASFSGRSRKIVTIHDLSFLRYPYFFSLRKNIWHRLVNTGKLLKKANAIVAVSRNTKRDIIELFDIDPEKIKVIYSGIDPSCRPLGIEDKKSEDIRFRYNLPEKFLLYLGTIEPRKNISGIIRAFDRFSEDSGGSSCYDLVIAGARGWKSGEIMRTWSNSKNRERIRFIGYINRGDKAYLYNMADLFIYPSFYEGFGFPPLEALSCGTPVVTSATSSLPEIVSGRAMLVNPFDVNQIAHAIYIMTSDPSSKETARKRGNEIADSFSWKKSASEYLDLFREYS